MTLLDAMTTALKFMGITIMGMGVLLAVVLYVGFLIDQVKSEKLRSCLQILGVLLLMFVGMTLVIYYGEGGFTSD